MIFVGHLKLRFWMAAVFTHDFHSTNWLGWWSDDPNWLENQLRIGGICWDIATQFVEFKCWDPVKSEVTTSVYIYNIRVFFIYFFFLSILNNWDVTPRFRVVFRFTSTMEHVCLALFEEELSSMINVFVWTHGQKTPKAKPKYLYTNNSCFFLEVLAVDSQEIWLCKHCCLRFSPKFTSTIHRT